MIPSIGQMIPSSAGGSLIPYYVTASNLYSTTLSYGFEGTYPTGIETGDILIGCSICSTGTSEIKPSGFDTVSYETHSSFTVTISKKIATGLESGDFTLTSNSAQMNAFVMYVFRGATASIPVTNEASSNIVVGSLTTVPSFSVSSNGSLAVAIISIEDNPTCTLSGTGWVQQSNKSTTTYTDGRIVLATSDMLTSGATSVLEASHSADYNTYTIFTLNI